MHYLTSIFLGLAALVTSFFGSPHFGNISLTTISGSDQQSNFPTTYNANNTALNNGKIDVGSTSIAAITTLTNLASVGTITSGVWNGTALTVPYGGTASTTLSLNQILLGNGTSLIKTVSGFGSSGQSLVSNGTGIAPSWQSVSFDTSASYSNTGSWAFAASTTFSGAATTTLNQNVSITASPTHPLYLRGFPYTFPASQGASSTVLTTNASGSLFWNTTWTLLAASTTVGASSPTITFASGYSDLHVVLTIPATAIAAAPSMDFNSDTGSNYGYETYKRYTLLSSASADTQISFGEATTSLLTYNIDITNISSTRKQVVITGTGSDSASHIPVSYTSTAVWNNTASQITSITFGAGTPAFANFPAGTTIRVYGQ